MKIGLPAYVLTAEIEIEYPGVEIVGGVARARPIVTRRIVLEACDHWLILVPPPISRES
jgi:hypothetical protein